METLQEKSSIFSHRWHTIHLCTSVLSLSCLKQDSITSVLAYLHSVSYYGFLIRLFLPVPIVFQCLILIHLLPYLMCHWHFFMHSSTFSGRVASDIRHSSWQKCRESYITPEFDVLIQEWQDLGRSGLLDPSTIAASVSVDVAVGARSFLDMIIPSHLAGFAFS